MNLDYSIIQDSDFKQSFKNSFIILFWVILLTLIFGVGSAYLVTFFNFPGANFFNYALILSFAIPPYIFGYSISAFFENFGIGYSLINFLIETKKGNELLPNLPPLFSAIISLSLTLYGYVYILTKTSFLNQSANLIDLGKSIGFSSTERLIKIILPCARPAIFIGISLVAMETLSDFGTVSHFGISTFTIEIYNSWFIFDDLETSNLLSLLLLFFILIFFLVENFSRKSYRLHSHPNDKILKKKKLKGPGSFFAFFFCFILFISSFIFPFFQMLFWALKFPEYYQNLDLLKLNFNTFSLILFTGILIIFFSLIVNFGNRNINSKFLNLLSNLSISGYAIPGIIISVSIISFFTVLNTIANLNLKSIFIGTFFALVMGYFFRFYSISFNSIKSSYLKLSISIDESAALIGLNKYKTLLKIHWPIMKRNIFFIFILIALEIIKELPITLILRPFNFETFSTKAYNFASQDLIEAAAIPSIFLIFWTTVFILISHKYFFESNK